jgi:hypothetical protein
LSKIKKNTPQQLKKRPFCLLKNRECSRKIMKKTELENCPRWLLDANTENENVEIVDGELIWHDGTWWSGIWYSGIWQNGIWHDGLWDYGIWENGTWEGGIWIEGFWYDGTWKNGVWKGGMWSGGTWEGGAWEGGAWCGGTWKDGIWYYGTWSDGTWEGGIWKGGWWHGGIWKDGIWKDGIWWNGIWQGKEDRLLFMSNLIGIVFDKDGYATAYRTTQKDGTGRYTKDFVQSEGEWYEEDVAPAGSGTCRKGIHVSSAPIAWTYFGVDFEAQMWEVKFKKEDLLDCDGEKARIRGGVFTKINYSF